MAVATTHGQIPINLLPGEIRARQRMRRILAGLGMGAVGVVVLLGLITFLQRQAISNAEGELRAEQAEASRLRAEVEALRPFEQLQLSIDQSRASLATALTGDIAWSRFTADLATNIPGDSWLTSLSLTAAPGQSPDGLPSFGTVQYSGFVSSFPGLSGWLNTMDGLEGLQFVYLGSGTKQDSEGREVVSFSATANLTEPMLSGRCQQEGARCP